MPRKQDHPTRSERSGRKDRKRSRDRRTRRTSSDEAEQVRDPGSGADTDVRLLVKSASSRAPGLDQAPVANDRQKGRKNPSTPVKRVKRQTRRVEDSDSSSDSSDDSSNTESDSPLFSFPQPEPYDGRPDLEAFDNWAIEVTAWAKHNRYSDEQVVRVFHVLVSGKAKTCIMAHIIPSHLRFRPPMERTLKAALRTVFEECFPPCYEMTLHKELFLATQGNLRIRDFAFGLKLRAKYLPYVNDQCLAAVFFMGINRRIRSRLIMEGIQQYGTDFDTMLDHALKYDLTRSSLRY